MECLIQSINRLKPHLNHRECDHLFVSNTLEYSNLCFVTGQNFLDMLPTLQTALPVSKRRGDLRSQALIKLHMGRLFYFSNQRTLAMASFSEGKKIVEDLGDEDILIQAGEFLGLYYHMLGMFIKARAHFERAVLSYEFSPHSNSMNPSAAMWMSYCDAYMGQFGQAVGRLAYHRKMAQQRSENSLATTLLSVLGIVLLSCRNLKKADSCPKKALSEAESQNNSLALWFSRAAISHIQILNGRPQEGRGMLAQALAEAKRSGLVRQYASPFVLEMAYVLDRLETEPINGFNFWDEVQTVMDEPNMHLKGVALRLMAEDSMRKGQDISNAPKLLETGIALLTRSGDPIQLGLTQLQLARLHLAEGKQKSARALAVKACQGLAPYGRYYFPDDLAHLITRKEFQGFQQKSTDEYLQKFIDIVDHLSSITEPDYMLSKVISSMNSFLGAERGAIFLSGKDKKNELSFGWGHNISKEEISSPGFHEKMALVKRAHQKKATLTVDLEKNSSSQSGSVICVPFTLDKGPNGVFFHDNSYLPNHFKFLNKILLTRIVSYLSRLIHSAFEYNRRMVKRHQILFDQTSNHSEPSILDQLTKSRRMLTVLSQVEKVVETDCTVLITGETGVGKELLARWLHRRSMRRDASFVVVDISTIPENLIESELFGFEKGAFTGANAQKIGRLEVADHGTLFLDEIGEIPKYIQTKILRVLQEKTLVRIGGNRTLTSDFRLIAATNRDLVEEVKSGRFREDLFYRLNVVPIVIPPLRDRKSDIIPIATYFLQIFSAKYNRNPYDLSTENIKTLKDYSWPGNVRELKNVIERSVLLSDGDRLEFSLPLNAGPSEQNIIADSPTLAELEKRYIEITLKKMNNRIGGPSGAAEILGVKRSSLYNRLKKHELR